MCYARRQRSSWARIKLSKKWYLKSLRTLNLSSSYDLLFYFCLSSILFQNFRVPSRTYYMLVLSSLLFNFQWPFRSPIFGELDYYITFLLACQEVFLKKFRFFSTLFLKSPRVPDSLPIISLCYCFVKRFFEKNFCFLPKKGPHQFWKQLSITWRGSFGS